jgi:large subunit ribosomal protein L1
MRVAEYELSEFSNLHVATQSRENATTMSKRSKKYLESKKRVNSETVGSFNDAIKMMLESSFAKFDETVDVAVRLGVDPRHADQMIRGSVVLPHGTGKKMKVLVFAKGEKEKEAADAGADFVGNEDLIEKIKNGWFGFDKAVATPDMMGSVGPRGLMPNAKTGTVTFDVARAVQDLKAGKIEFKAEKTGIVQAPMGKVSFGVDKIAQNMAAFFDMIMRLKPASSKGTYLKGIAISTTMGPGLKIDSALIKDLLK